MEQNVEANDRVVAIVNDMAVVKNYKPAGNYALLEPEAKGMGYKPIVVSDENARIFGKVIGVIAPNQSDEEDVRFESLESEQI